MQFAQRDFLVKAVGKARVRTLHGWKAIKYIQRINNYMTPDIGVYLGAWSKSKTCYHLKIYDILINSLRLSYMNALYFDHIHTNSSFMLPHLPSSLFHVLFKNYLAQGVQFVLPTYSLVWGHHQTMSDLIFSPKNPSAVNRSSTRWADSWAFLPSMECWLAWSFSGPGKATSVLWTHE